MVPSHHIDGLPLPGLANQLGKLGLFLHDRHRVGGPQQQVDRQFSDQQLPEVLVGHFGDDQAQVDEVTVDRVEPFAGLVQRLEAALEVRSSRLGIVGDHRFGGHHRLALQEHLVEVAEVVHVPSQQFHLQVTAAQGQEVGGEIGVQCCGFLVFAEQRQRGGDHFVAIGEIGDHTAAGLPGPSSPVVAEPVGAGRGDQEQLAGGGVGRLVSPLPVGDHPGGCQQSWVPGNGERIQQARGLILVQLGWKVLETVAGDQDDDVGKGLERLLLVRCGTVRRSIGRVIGRRLLLVGSRIARRIVLGAVWCEVHDRLPLGSNRTAPAAFRREVCSGRGHRRR